MRTLFIAAVFAGAALIGIASVFQPQERLIWNRTESAPKGLYWLDDDPFTLGRWVVVSAKSDDARWAQERGYVGKDWPLLKRIAGLPGDEICRNEGLVSVNGSVIGEANTIDSRGRELPGWEGCFTLTEAELFLMNAHPDSLDGRYFGATRQSDLGGVVALLWQY